MPDVSISGIEFSIKGSTDKASDSIDKLTQKLNGLKTSLAGVQSVSKVSTSIKSVGNAAKSANKPLSNFVASIKRIAFYRVIRSIIKSITEAIKEGAQTFYDYTKQTNPLFTNYAKALDGVKLASIQMKNQLGAAFGSLFTALSPIITSLISLVTRLANALTMVFARMSGASGWFRATEAAAGAIDDVGNSAKEALKYLAPFDELNRLPAENAGGSGSATGGNGGGYEWVEFEQFDIGDGLRDIVKWFEDAFRNIADWIENVDWMHLASNIVTEISNAFDKVDWAGLASSIAEFMGAALGAVIGFVMGAINDLVTAVSDAIYNAFHNDDGTQKTGKEIWEGICQGIKNAIVNVGTWIKTNIWDPFVDGFKAVFGIHSPATTMEEPGQMIGEGILEGILKPFKNIGTWIKENIWDPFINGIREKFSNFNLREWIFGSGNDNSVDLDVSANVTDIKDSVPKDKKKLGDVAAEFGSTIKDKLTNAQRTISTWAQYNASKNNLDENERTVSTWSKFTQVKDGLNAAKKTIATKANFSSMKNSLSAALRTFDSKANFSSMKNSLSGDKRTFDSKADFKYKNDALTTDDKTFDSKANFNKYKIDPEGSLKTGYGVWSYATAWFNDYDTDFDETPTIDVKANVTSVQTTDGQDIRDLMAGLATGGALYGGAWHDIPQYARGTTRAHGSLFVAGEAGPEVVGHIGGRTEVLNRSQLASTMYAAVRSAMAGISMHVYDTPSAAGTYNGGEMDEETMYRAMLRALNDSDAFPEEINLDGATVYKKMVQRNRMERARTGMNPMLSY